MSQIIVLGAGVCGLASAMLLGRDGHDVTVLERDPQPVPPSAGEAQDAWNRRGVAQFRQPHYLQPRAHQLLESSFPDITQAMLGSGFNKYDALTSLPPGISDRAARPGDDRFLTLTGRRPKLEHAFAAVAEPVVDIRRGVTVTGLRAAPYNGVPHVTGVDTAEAGPHAAELVVDAMGRRSVLSTWLAAIGARPPIEEAEDSGFSYYTRYFRSNNGATPEPRGRLLEPIGSFSVLTLPADDRWWSVTAVTASRDQPLKELRRADRWERLIAACPQQAHWLDGEPLTDVLPISGLVDRYRRFVVDGAPVATGIVAVGDSWACTNPSVGRGIAMGLLHAHRLRDVIREHLGAPARLAETWDAVTEAELTPWYRGTLSGDRARLAAIAAELGGPPVPPPADAREAVARAFPIAAVHDADLYRALLEVVCVLTPPREVLSRPGLAERILSVADGRDGSPAPGPTRAEALALIA
ncbi:FAD-dependent oxidoreductase [soil metagenome]